MLVLSIATVYALAVEMWLPLGVSAVVDQRLFDWVVVILCMQLVYYLSRRIWGVIDNIKSETKPNQTARKLSE